eukprot:12577746-Alexandrium_andersonii.AAC.1
MAISIFGACSSFAVGFHQDLVAVPWFVHSRSPLLPARLWTQPSPPKHGVRAEVLCRLDGFPHGPAGKRGVAPPPPQR